MADNRLNETRDMHTVKETSSQKEIWQQRLLDQQFNDEIRAQREVSEEQAKLLSKLSQVSDIEEWYDTPYNINK